jgi:lipoprotein NlpI
LKILFILAATFTLAGSVFGREGMTLSTMFAVRDSIPTGAAADTSDTSGSSKSQQDKFAQDSSTAISARARQHFAAGKYALAAIELRKSIGFVDDIDGRLWLYFAEWKASGNKIASDHLKKYINDAQAERALMTPFIESLFEAILRDGGEEVVFQKIAASDPKFQTMLTFKANFYLGLNNLTEGARVTARKYWERCLASGLSQFDEFDYAMQHMPN